MMCKFYFYRESISTDSLDKSLHGLCYITVFVGAYMSIFSM